MQCLVLPGSRGGAGVFAVALGNPSGDSSSLDVDELDIALSTKK